MPKRKVKVKKTGKLGRPRIELDLGLIADLAEIGATIEEIAHTIGVSRQTLYNRKDFLDTYKQGLAKVKKSLRRKQLEIAKKGNVTMLIWLGKQLLGQKDRHELSGDEMQPLQLVLTRVDTNGGVGNGR